MRHISQYQDICPAQKGQVLYFALLRQSLVTFVGSMVLHGKVTYTSGSNNRIINFS